jgi:hypothetical protein
MAIYIPASRRRRRIVGIAVVAVVVGLLIGLLVGRLVRPSVDDEVHARQRDAQQLIARLDGLALEYAQTGASGQAATDAREGSLDAAGAISADAQALVDDLPWLAHQQRAAVVSAVEQVRAAISSNGSIQAVSQVVDAAEAALRNAAGLSSA